MTSQANQTAKATVQELIDDTNATSVDIAELGWVARCDRRWNIRQYRDNIPIIAKLRELGAVSELEWFEQRQAGYMTAALTASLVNWHVARHIEKGLVASDWERRQERRKYWARVA